MKPGKFFLSLVLNIFERIFFSTLFITFLFLSGSIDAQQSKCGSDDAALNLGNKMPGVVQQWKKANAIIRNQIENRSGRIAQGVVTIPVVVHIVYHDSSENISDAQVFSQIDVLNEDYRRLNADTNITRSIFKPVAGDPHIEFCLARRSPSGDTTSGITRTFTNHLSWDCTDSMKYSAYGGIDPWPNTGYLNIWVVNLNCADGYAYYPGTPAPFDGVVIHYYVFGRSGNIAPGFNGRTTTHEVGHWLGLYHPFEYGLCDGTDTSDCLGAGDYVCDTPASDAPGYGCDTTLNTCSDTPVDLPNEIENYMDYADDACRNMFSLGQIDRMRASLSSYRISLLTSTGCLSPLVNYYDASLIEIIQPLQQICSSSFLPVIRIGNNGSSSMYSLKINYQLDGGLWNQFAWNGNLASGSSTVINLPVISVSPGTHNFSCYVSDPDSMSDQNSANDVGNLLFEALTNGDGLALPLSEGFQTSSFPPAGWYISNPDYDRTWEKFSGGGGYGLSNSSACYRNFYNGTTDTRDGLISPEFDFMSVSNSVLTFDVAYAMPSSAFYSDTLKVYYSTDCGTNWNLIWEKGGSSLSTAPTPSTFDEFIPDSSQWRTETVNGNIFSGNSLVSIKFEDVSFWSNNLYLDNINITTPTSLNEFSGNNSWRLFPNPSDGNFIIRSSEKADGFSCKVCSLVGECIKEFYCKGSSMVLDLSSLEPGIYFLDLTGKENISVFKIEIVR